MWDGRLRRLNDDVSVDNCVDAAFALRNRYDYGAFASNGEYIKAASLPLPNQSPSRRIKIINKNSQRTIA